MRVSFLIDGFNLYHSILEAEEKITGVSLKWLNLFSLCSSYLYLIDRTAQGNNIYYFSALARHLDKKYKGKVLRHKTYIRALKSTGINVELGRFKRKMVWCNECSEETEHYEEKETDVAIAVKLFEIFCEDECDVAVIVSGDTDLAPALRTVKRLYPKKNIIFLFPYHRKNNELDNLADDSFNIKYPAYQKHQFPNPVITHKGIKIFKPYSW